MRSILPLLHRNEQTDKRLRLLLLIPPHIAFPPISPLAGPYLFYSNSFGLRSGSFSHTFFLLLCSCPLSADGNYQRPGSAFPFWTFYFAIDSRGTHARASKAIAGKQESKEGAMKQAAPVPASSFPPPCFSLLFFSAGRAAAVCPTFILTLPSKLRGGAFTCAWLSWAWVSAFPFDLLPLNLSIPSSLSFLLLLPCLGPFAHSLLPSFIALFLALARRRKTLSHRAFPEE